MRLLQNAHVTYFGIEQLPEIKVEFLDLNSTLGINNWSGQFDLVLCSQVIEHIFNLPLAVDTICRLSKPKGFVWFGFPTSNFPHGSPEYFSAGYPFQTIVHFLPAQFKVVTSGQIGSKRHYLWIHTLRDWPSLAELTHPIASIWTLWISNTGICEKFRRTKKRLRHLGLILGKNTINSELQWATEGWVLAQKTN